MPDDLLSELYQLATMLLYLAASAVVAMGGIVFFAARQREAVNAVSRTALWVGGACLAVQLGVSVAGVLFYMRGDIPASVLQILLFNWLPVLFAICCGPMGLALIARQQLDLGVTVGRRWTETSIATVGIIIYSFGFFWVVAKFVDLQVQDLIIELTENATALALFIPVALLAAIVEEVIFRLGLQGALEEGLRRYRLPIWPAVVVVSLIWALGHSAMVTPHGAKEFQIFVIGLALGWLKIRHGAAACIAAHMGLNVSAIVVDLLFDLDLF